MLDMYKVPITERKFRIDEGISIYLPNLHPPTMMLYVDDLLQMDDSPNWLPVSYKLQHMPRYEPEVQI